MPSILSGMGGMLSREKVAKAATELAEHLQIIENIRALQTAQKEISNEIKSINQHVYEIQREFRVLKAEITLEAMRETQSIVNSVQGGLNQRLEILSNKMAVIEATIFPESGDRPSATFRILGQEPTDRTSQLEGPQSAKS